MKHFVLVSALAALVATAPVLAADPPATFADASSEAHCAGIPAANLAHQDLAAVDTIGVDPVAVETAAAGTTRGQQSLVACGPWIESEPCQTGGNSVGTCSQCSGQCWTRYEGYVHYFWYGKKSDSIKKKVYCSEPTTAIATCNTTCS